MGNDYMAVPPGAHEAQPLMAGGGAPSDVGAAAAGLFVPFSVRQPQDKPYSYVWGATYVLTLVLGIFTIVNR